MKIDTGGRDTDFSAEEAERARDLIDRYGAEVENATTDILIEVLDGGDLAEIVSWLRVRKCIRGLTQSERYTRRLSDKIVWAVEQALEQGRLELARRLRPAYRAAMDEESKFRDDRRQQAPD